MPTPPTTTPAPVGARGSSTQSITPLLHPRTSTAAAPRHPDHPNPRRFLDLPPGVEATRLLPVRLSGNLSDIRWVQGNVGCLPEPHPEACLSLTQLLHAAEQSSALLSVTMPAIWATVSAMGASAEAARARFDSAEMAIAR